MIPGKDDEQGRRRRRHHQQPIVRECVLVQQSPPVLHPHAPLQRVGIAVQRREVQVRGGVVHVALVRSVVGLEEGVDDDVSEGEKHGGDAGWMRDGLGRVEGRVLRCEVDDGFSVEKMEGTGTYSVAF